MMRQYVGLHYLTNLVVIVVVAGVCIVVVLYPSYVENSSNSLSWCINKEDTKYNREEDDDGQSEVTATIKLATVVIEINNSQFLSVSCVTNLPTTEYCYTFSSSLLSPTTQHLSPPIATHIYARWVALGGTSTRLGPECIKLKMYDPRGALIFNFLQ